MSPTALATLVTRCRGLCLRNSKEADAALLERFARQRDAAAFEQLVARYAPLVWGVCRRILPGEADCEDAFQATFLALVRQAGSLDPSRTLGGWLHTVAVRIARKAQVRSLRQRLRPVPPDWSAPGDVAGDLGSRELLRAVDEEIERLPAMLRVPIILCCLEGQTRDEAAEVIGCSVAAVKSRLERGRGLLRQRLERRGIQLPVALLVLSLTGGRVSAVLQAKAVQCALGSAPPAVAALVTAIATPLPVKLALTAVSLLVAGVLGFGAFRVAETGLPKDSPTPANSAPAQAPQPPAPENAQPRDRFGDPLPEGAVRRFGTLRFRHREIANLAFTPDGKQLIAGSGRTSLAVFDAATGRKLREVGKVSSNNVYGFALSPDGKQVVCCGFDVTVWDLETGQLVRELGCGRCQAVAFSPDGTKVVVVKEHRALFQVIEVATGRELAGWAVREGRQFMDGVAAVAFSPDGKSVAAVVTEFREDQPSHFTAVSAQVRLWDAEKGAPQGTIGPADALVYVLAFQPGTQRLATLGKDGIIRFWDMETRKEVHRITVAKGVDTVTGLRFSADGRRCVVLTQGRFLSILEVKDGKELRQVEIGPTPRWSAVALALSPDGRTVAGGKRYGEACVRVWDVESGAERLADAGHRGAAAISLSADDRTLVSQGGDGREFHWDLRTGEAQVKPAETREEVGSPVWTPEGRTIRGPRWQLAIQNQTVQMEVRSLDGARLLRKAKAPSLARGLALSPDGTHLAVAFQDRGFTVLLWNPEREEEPRKLQGHPDACQCMVFSHDGKRLITGAGTHNAYRSETVWVWDVATAQVVRKLATTSAPGKLLLTADDRVLITGGRWNDAAVRVWDMETGKQLATLADPSLTVTSEEQGKIESQLAIAGLALSPDERFLAVVTNRGDTSAVSVWETGAWKKVRAFAPTQPRTTSHSIAFSRDGRSVFVANSDSTILEWAVGNRRGRKTEAPDRARLDALWQTLLEAPDKAYPAVWEMLDHPTEAIRFLKIKLAPVKPADGQRVRQLLGQLDAETFREREEASRQLLALGEPAVPALRQALKEKRSLEVKARIERLVEALTGGASPDQLRLRRALAVLEWSRLADAHDFLGQLAGGNPTARFTQAAKAAVKRRQGLTGSQRPER
jgi:RNA polymerase sigma factor (sigma-70 family)